MKSKQRQKPRADHRSVAALKTYRIDMGNSSTGSVGFVAYVSAPSRSQALARLRTAVAPDGYEIVKEHGFTVIAYLNPSQVRLDEIELA